MNVPYLPRPLTTQEFATLLGISEDEVETLINEINEVAHSVGAPDAIIKGPMGLWMTHPGLQRLVAKRPDLLDQLRNI